MRRIAAVGAALAAAVAAGCSGAATAPEGIRACGEPLDALPIPPYAERSVWNRPIPRTARVHPRSTRFVRGLAEAARARGFVLSVREYTVPVYVANAGTKRHNVALTAPWADKRLLLQVPIPADAKPDPESDGHLAIIDLREGCEYDFWRARRSGSGWSASWGTVLPIAGDGVNRDAGARASGIGLLAGLVFPEELRRRRIDHALVFTTPFTRRDFVPPARRSDGDSRRPDAMPEGTRVQLDPSLDLSTLDLRPYERTIATALQRYGMILGDTGGTVGLFAAHPQSVGRNAYDGLLPAGDYTYLSRIPLARFRVLVP